jgi:hypothetical protein
MARSKEPPKPLFNLKHDFYASLDNVAHEAIMLLQAIDMALKHGAVSDTIAPTLKERSAAFRASLSSDD